MKKITHLLVLLAVFVGLQANAQIATFPYNEDFESGDGGWIANNTTNGSWALGAPANTIINSADSGANAWVTNLTGNYSASESSFVESPVFDFSALTAPALEFSIWWNSENSWDGMVLQSSIDGGTTWQNVGNLDDPNNWFNDDSIGGSPGGQQIGWTGTIANEGSNGWVIARHALTGLAGESAVSLRVAFGSDGSVVDEGAAFDTVDIFEVTCPEPSNISVASTTDSTASIIWDLGGAETAWEVAVQLAGTGAPTGNGDAATSNTTYIATGLTPASTYEVYVRSSCGAEFSSWVGPINFDTECVSFVAPYTQDFENGGTIPLCWSMSGGEDWNFDDDPGFNHIGNDGVVNGSTASNGYFAWVDSSGSDSAATLLSPLVDVSGLTTPSISFYELSNNEGNANSQLDVEVWDGAAWNLMGTYNTNTSGWEKKTIDLSTLTITGDVQARFIFSEVAVPSDFYDDLAIDDVTFGELPTCLNPSVVTIDSATATTATISWIAPGTQTAWEVAVQAIGTGVPVGNGDATTTNPYVATGLTPATNYEVYVRAVCGGEYSDWIGPVNFATECVTFTAPYTEGFENGGTIPLCWTMSGGEDWNFDNDPGFEHIGNNGVIDGATATNGYFAWVDSSGSDGAATLTTPLVDISALITPSLSFYELSHNEGNANSQLDVEVWDGAAWNLMGTYNTNTAGWELKYLDLSGLTVTGDVQARFIFSEIVSGDFYDDIAIDDVTFDELPPCVQPGGISVTNITGTSADISWMQGGGETAWEYVIQPAGTGVPTAGTPTTVTTVNETGLSFQMDYEIYVRADCGIDGFSAWSGPVNFSTSVQLNYTVDCTLGPVNVTYCYGPNDTNVFTFTSTDGTALNFTVNSGNVESGWDEFQVFDTDGSDLNVLTPYGNGGDLAGITYQSTGDTISYSIDSDFSGSCSSSTSINSLDITVSCATCINPVATYVVVDDCANGDQFLVDVNVNSLGDATSVVINDNQGSAPVSVSATGTTQFGPYPFATDIIFTIENEQDGNCIITSAAIQLLACPPDNDNCVDATVAAVNDDGSCTVTTPGTILEATDSGVPAVDCAGDSDDDVWFEFTALHELEVISLINIQGGTTNLDFGLYEGTCDALVEIECYTTASGISPSLTIGNTYYIRVFSGGSTPESSTFDLCITEAPTGTSCESAGTFCNNNGVQTTPNLTNFPSGGEIACLFTTPNPVWNIIQIGDSGLVEIEISQTSETGEGLDVDFVLWGPFDSATDFCTPGTLDNGCPSPSECPNNTGIGDFYPYGNIMDCSYSAASLENLTIDNAISGEIYVLLVTNYANDPGEIEIEQTNSGGSGAGSTVAELDVEITSNDVTFIDDDNDELTASIANLCGFADTTLIAESPFAETYEWFQNGIILDNQTAGTLVVTESDFYSVVAYDSDCEVYSQYDVVVNFYNDAIANSVPDIITCDDISGDGTEDFNLDAQTATILGAQSETDFVVTYHATLGDAQAGINALASPYSAMDGTVIYVRVEDVNAVGSGSGCASTNTLFNLVITGALPEITGVDLEACDDDSNDGVELFDLDAHNTVVLNGQDATSFAVSYYLTQADADAGVGALTSPYENISNPQTIIARVENIGSTDCYVTEDLDLIVGALPDTTIDTSAIYEVCPNATSPITITATGNNYAESEVTIAWYRDGIAIPGQTSLTLNNVLLLGTYTIEVTFNNSSCPSTSEDVEVYELENCIIPQGISPNGDNKNDFFDLSSFDVQSLEIFNRYGTKVYSRANYTNEWFGQSKDGDELPVGTYYYVMKYQGGKVKTSWVYINR